MLVSSNVAETDKAAWAIGTAYVVGNEVMVTVDSTTGGTISSAHLATYRGNFIAGNAFFIHNATDLSRYVGTDLGSTPYKIVLTDSGGKTATGYIAGGGSGIIGKDADATVQALGSEMVTNGEFRTSASWTWGAGWSVVDRKAVSANGVLLSQDINLVEWQLYYTSFQVAAYTSGNVALYLGGSTNYFAQRSSAATFAAWGMSDGGSENIGLNGFTASSLTCDNVSCKAVTEPPNAANGGLHIVSSKNGTYRDWAEIETGFNPREIVAYTISNEDAYHKTYECLVNNTGYFPPQNLTGVSPKWMETGATNRWQAFDAKCASQTENASSIQYVLTPGSLDSIAFFNLDADSIAITQKEATGGATLHSETITLSGATEAVTTALHSGYASNEITITITKSGTAKCGEIVMGLKYNLGDTLSQEGVDVGTTDFSIIENDAFGNLNVTPRDYSSSGDFVVLVTNTNADDLYETLAQYVSTPLVYIGYASYASMILYGYYEDFSIKMDSRLYAHLSMNIQGLT
jgi:hypothetical protein